jgi:hypothetical protein
MSGTCPIEYDHTDDMDECMVCGWRLEDECKHPEPRRPRDISALTGPERIREAIDRLNGSYAPQSRIVICGPSEDERERQARAQEADRIGPDQERADTYEREDHS